MLTVNLVLAGFGHVGQAFFRVVQEKASICRDVHGLDLRFRAVLKSDGGFHTGRLLKPDDLFREGRPWLDGNPAWRPGFGVGEALNSSEPGCLVECTPSDIRTGEPALAHMTQAFHAGWNVVSASKGALVVAFKKLRRLAAERRTALRFSGATAAALPALDVGLYSLAGSEVVEIQAILNGTSNYILTRMGTGNSFEEALEEARARGIAEADPTLDVDGWDTACKLLLIANAVLGLDFELADVAVDGIANVTLEDIAAVGARGATLKLLGVCERPDPAKPWRLSVGPRPLSASHPLHGVSGTEKGITFRTDTLGAVTVTGGGSDPRGTGAALLKDIINIHRAAF
jgi:homoserine dehydrogenase